MKKVFVLFLIISIFVVFASGNTDYEQVLQERNLLYNEVQLAMTNDAVTPIERLQMLQNLIQKDNQIIDEWIPALQKESDSLKMQLGNFETSFEATKTEMQEKHDILLYAGSGAAGLFLIFFILFIAAAVGKSKAKKKLKNALKSIKEHDKLLEVHQNTKDLLDDADNKVDELQKNLQQKTNEVDIQKSLVKEAEQKFSSQISQLKTEKMQTEREMNELKLSITKRENEINEIKLQHNKLMSENEVLKQNASLAENTVLAEKTVIAEKDVLISDLKKEILQIKDSFKQNDSTAHEEEIRNLNRKLENERDENIKRLREKEFKLKEFSKEINDLKTSLDEKKENISDLKKELLQIKDSSKQNDCTTHEEEIRKLNRVLKHEREENIKRLHEKEILLQEFRNEINELRTNLDEKNKVDDHIIPTVQTNLNEEIARLKRVNTEQTQLLEEYRLTLEKELKVRHEIEEMLKKFFQK